MQRKHLVHSKSLYVCCGRQVCWSLFTATGEAKNKFLKEEEEFFHIWVVLEIEYVMKAKPKEQRFHKRIQGNEWCLLNKNKIGTVTIICRQFSYPGGVPSWRCSSDGFRALWHLLVQSMYTHLVVGYSAIKYRLAWRHVLIVHIRSLLIDLMLLVDIAQVYSNSASSLSSRSRSSLLKYHSQNLKQKFQGCFLVLITYQVHKSTRDNDCNVLLHHTFPTIRTYFHQVPSEFLSHPSV